MNNHHRIKDKPFMPILAQKYAYLVKLMRLEGFTDAVRRTVGATSGQPGGAQERAVGAGDADAMGVLHAGRRHDQSERAAA